MKCNKTSTVLDDIHTSGVAPPPLTEHSSLQATSAMFVGDTVGVGVVGDPDGAEVGAWVGAVGV